MIFVPTLGVSNARYRLDRRSDAMWDEGWYLRERGKVKGPFSVSELLAMKDRGSLNRFHFVSRDNTHWVPASEWVMESGSDSTTPPSMPRTPLRSESGGKSFRSNGSPVTASSALVIEGAEPRQEENVPLVTVDPTLDDFVLIPFPVIILLVMHFITCGLYPFLRITGLHSKLPKRFPSDLTGARAIGLFFVPFFNLYWGFVVSSRLCDRVNELLAKYALPGRVSNTLAVTMCGFLVGPALFMMGGCVVLLVLWMKEFEDYKEAILIFFQIPLIFVALDFFLVIPLFAALMQGSVNRLGRAQIARLLAK